MRLTGNKLIFADLDHYQIYGHKRWSVGRLLNYIRKQILSKLSGARDNVAKLVIFIVDSNVTMSSNHFDISAATKLYALKNTAVVTLVLGSQLNTLQVCLQLMLFRISFGHVIFFLKG